jgi:nucleoside-diphosphate-sugar epimerase
VKVLVTGANGFVGAALTTRLVHEIGCVVVASVRNQSTKLRGPIIRVETGPLGPETDWHPAVERVDTVVHLAARVHETSDRAATALAKHRLINVAATLALARQAASAGAKRFIFLSSVKVNGESGYFTETDQVAPVGAYAISKHEAEVALRRIAAETGMEVVIIRPSLVYGPGAKANFLTLLRAVSWGVPLPFGAVENLRSLLALNNLVDFIVACIEAPAAANETFMLSDGEDLSTPDLIRRLARAMGRPARLVAVPSSVLFAGASIVGRSDVARRLLGSLQVDIAKARRLVHWNPPTTVDEGLRLAVGAR